VTRFSLLFSDGVIMGLLFQLKLKNSIKILFALLLTNYFLLAQQPQWRLATSAPGAPAAIDINRRNPDIIYALGDYALVRSTDRGAHWDSISALRTDIGAIKIDPTDSKILFASVFGYDLGSNNVVASTDGGVDWKVLFIGRAQPAAVVEIDPVDPKTVYVGVGPGEVRRSIDGGQTWETIFFTWSLTSLVIAGSNNNVLYAGGTTGVFKSVDRGKSWTELSLGFQIRSGTAIAVHPRNPDIVYVAIFGYGTESGVVYKSTDGGLSWTEKSDGLRDYRPRILSIAINPKNPNHLFIGTYGADSAENKIFFRSTDGGDHWIDFASGLPTSGGATVNCIAIDTLNDRVYIGLASRQAGLYVLDAITNEESTHNEIPNTFSLSQNYPNPFNSRTEIKFEVSSGAYVSLKVYDFLGRHVATLVNAKKGPGVYRVFWDASPLPSGVYFYRMEAGNFADTKKLIVLK